MGSRLTTWTLALACGLGVARAQDAQAPQLQVRTDQAGRVLVVLLDPATQRLAVYAHHRGEPLRLEAVRNYGYDLRFQEWTQRGKEQRPSVKDMREAVEEGERKQRRKQKPGLPGLVELELELGELRGQLAEAPPGKPRPTVRGVPLAERVAQLERESVRARLALVEDHGDWVGFQRALLAAIDAKAAAVRERLGLHEALRSKLPAGHGALPQLDRSLQRLRGELAGLEGLRQAEAGE